MVPDERLKLDVAAVYVSNLLVHPVHIEWIRIQHQKLFNDRNVQSSVPLRKTKYPQVVYTPCPLRCLILSPRGPGVPTQYESRVLVHFP